jgi:hypothetical protein
MTMGLSDTTRVVVDRHNFGGFAPAVDLALKSAPVMMTGMI